MAMKYYIPALVSVIALVAYFSPWYGDPRANLGYYTFAFFWFMVAWIPMGAQLILSIVRGRRGDGAWRHHLLSACLVAICYVGLFVGWANGYLLTI